MELLDVKEMAGVMEGTTLVLVMAVVAMEGMVLALEEKGNTAVDFVSLQGVRSAMVQGCKLCSLSSDFQRQSNLNDGMLCLLVRP